MLIVRRKLVGVGGQPPNPRLREVAPHLHPEGQPSNPLSSGIRFANSYRALARRAEIHRSESLACSVVSFVWLAFTLTTFPARGDDPNPVALEYDAPPQCPTRQDFIDAVL